MAKKQLQPKKQTAAEGPGLLTPFMGKSTEAPAEGHRTNAGEADTVDSPGLGKQAMAEIYDALGVKEAGIPFLQQDRPAKVKEVYRALKRDHPEYSAQKKARIASSVAKEAVSWSDIAANAPDYLHMAAAGGKQVAHHAAQAVKSNPDLAGAGAGGAMAMHAARKTRDAVKKVFKKKAGKQEFEAEMSEGGNQEKMKDLMDHHAKQNFGKTPKQMSRHERKAASELAMNHPHFQKIKSKHNVTHHDPVSKTTVEDVAKQGSYIPESERLHKVIRQHARKGHRAELKRLMAEGGKKGGRKGAAIGAIIGALGGGAAGLAKGMTPAQALASAAGGAVVAGGAGRGIGAIPGRKRGKEEAEKRQEAVKATRSMTPQQRRRYFEELAADRRHREHMAAKKGKSEFGKESAVKEALIQRSTVDSPSHRAGIVAGMEAAAKCSPELERHLQDANARNWPVGRARTSMEMSQTGEFVTHD